MMSSDLEERGLDRAYRGWHMERTPSLALYPHGGFICYGCGHVGDITYFVFEHLTIGGDYTACLPSREKLDDFFRNLRGTSDPSRARRINRWLLT